MSARKEFNRTLTALAREAGAYDTLLARWDLVSAQRDAGVTPKVALTAILGDDMPATVAAPVEVSVKDLRTPHVATTLEERLTSWIDAAKRRPTEADHMAFPSGHARVNVYGVKGNSKVARSLKAVGFYREGVGHYSLAVFADGQGMDAAMERARALAVDVDRSLRIHRAEFEDVTASTVID